MKDVFHMIKFPPASLKPFQKSSLEEFTRTVSEIFADRLNSIILYGSHARGDALPDSDIDILIVLETSQDLNHDWDECIDVAADIASNTGLLISVMVCLERDYAERQHPLLINIRREGIVVE